MLSVKELSQHLHLSIHASLLGASEILKVYEEDFKVEYKSDNSPVTLADKNANAIIEKTLAPSGINFIGEENEQVPFDTRKDWNQFWLVDPLDGTKEFVKRNGEFTVNIALIENNKPVLGVIYSPVFKDLYFACNGLGSFKIDRHKHIEMGYLSEYSLEEIIRASTRLPITTPKIFTVVASRSHMDSQTKRFVKKLEEEHTHLEIINAGSSIKMCMVAEGTANIYPRFGRTCEWDTAAGQAIVENAGGKFLDYDSQEPLTYNKENLDNKWFVVKTQ